VAKKESQLTFQKTSGWGGKRKGSGRKNLSGTVNHMARPKINLKAPANITLKLKKGLPNLRTKGLLKEFNTCIKKAREHGLYVIHFSLLTDHIHMIIEADGNNALGSGMRSLAGRFAKIIQKRVIEKGAVFKGRYHLRLLKTPTEVKNALEYVLLNHSKHIKSIEQLDPFSSAKHFKGWKKLLGHRFANIIQIEVEFLKEDEGCENILSSPQSWLCKSGWERACG
jgi:REP element-mobilizing transposase RayT